MHSRLEMLGIIVQIALRNLFASRLKTLIVGGIIGFGAMLVVVGTSLLDSVNHGMSSSIVGSIAGHIQVYNADSKDELALFGGMMGDPDLKPMEDFSRIKKALMEVENVRAVIPMGVAEALASGGNELDFALERLRAIVKQRQAGEAVDEAVYAATKDHVRQMIALLLKDAQNATALVEDRVVDPKAVADVTRASQEPFWAEFEQDPLAALEFLENRIAPQSVDGAFIFVRYIGTDLASYRKAFDRIEMVEGTPVPEGQRGIVVPRYYAEEWLKLKIALRLDKIREARQVNGKRIAGDEELQRFVKENTQQVREIVIQLDSLKKRTLVERLQKALGSKEEDVSVLLAQAMQTDDQNFEERYQLFYEQVAPLVKLYTVKPGDTLTIKAFTKSGYVKSVNVKLYGIYQFKGLEKSAFAGFISLMDIMSFRDLYGYVTADKAAEIKRLKEASGAKAVDRDRAEDELFGSGEAVVEAGGAQGFDEFAGIDTRVGAADEAARVYTPEEIEQGVAVNAAVLLKDPKRLPQTMKAIEEASKKAGLNLKVVDWQKAAGMVGQLINILSLVLVTVVLIIFLIALVIINNSMVMATLQRVKEIGTMRAIGAQRRFVLVMIGIETVAVGLLFGALGAGAGALIVEGLANVGIPATSQETQFLFSGPRLFPTLSGSNLLIALAIVLVVSIVSSFYPAVLATRVTPLEAMQSED